MGSWANSLHVRHADPAVVAQAIRAPVEATGHRLDTRPQPALAAVGAGHGSSDELDAGLDLGSERRGIRVYRPIDGWIGVLDNGDITELAAELSGQLETDTLVVMVNDSDSWYYELRRKGAVLDEFDSMGAEEDDGGLSPELEAAMERGDEEEITRLMQAELLANAPQGPIVLPDGSSMLPPELALLRSRIAEGQASLWDRIRYCGLWMRLMWRLLTGGLRGNLQVGFDIPRATTLTEADLRRHIDHVREFFPRASEATLRRLLLQSRFPSEDLLADFLATVGLPPLYAHLSYSYLEDFGLDELADEGIVESADLRFTP